MILLKIKLKYWLNNVDLNDKQPINIKKVIKLIIHQDIDYFVMNFRKIKILIKLI